jgi:hypothetical protein
MIQERYPNAWVLVIDAEPDDSVLDERNGLTTQAIGGMVNGFEIQVESIMLQSIIGNGITLFVYDLCRQIWQRIATDYSD